MRIARSPWARSWINMQTDKSKPGGVPRDWYGETLLVLIGLMLAALIGYHLGKSDGLEDGRRIGEAETWAKLIRDAKLSF